MRECPINKRQLCNFIGSEGCEKCVIPTLGSKIDPVDYADNWDVTLSLLPDDIDELHLQQTCSFCKEEPNEKIGYEELSMKHREPVHMKGMFFGFGSKVEGDVGSLVDIPIAVCSKCRKKLLIDKCINFIGGAVGVIVGILVLLLTGLYEKLDAISWALPIALLAVVTIAGYISAKMMKGTLRKNAQKEMYIDVRDIPQVSKMLLLGWTPMQSDKSGEPNLAFKKRKVREHMMYKTQVRPQENEN